MIGRTFILLFLWTTTAFGAITPSGLTAGGNAGCVGPTIATAQFTPTAGRLVFACITTEIGQGFVASPVTLGGNNLTWVEVTNRLNNASTMRTTLLRAMGAAPTTGAATFTVDGDQSNCTWAIGEFAGVDTTGTNGSGAVIASNLATNYVSGIALTVTLPNAFGSATNAAVGCFSSSSNVLLVPGSPFTEVIAQATGFGSRSMLMSDGADNTVDMSHQGSPAALNGIAVEIKDASGVPAAIKKRSAPRFDMSGLDYFLFYLRVAGAVRGGYVAG